MVNLKSPFFVNFQRRRLPLDKEASRYELHNKHK